ncbi:LamG-like jellyroll fold domain-containing protein, partial [Saccharicrinis sp. FJH62]|uniref:LamG-like jellyroll fold domain-containing protein n=1 Tax=Saccharicrinis sp. FJH62 TaxID=3344657 RepID=UPI0035D4864C
MKKIDIKLYVMACMLLVTSLSFGQLKFGDRSSVGQTLTVDNSTGVSVLDLSFNTDKSVSSMVLNADSAAEGKTYYDISIQKCTTNKGFQVKVFDESDAAVYNSDFECRDYNNYRNPVRVASIDSLVSILDAFAVNDPSTTKSRQLPAHCLFDQADDDQAFGAWPGKLKKVEYGYHVKFNGLSVDSDITFSIDTYDEGNTGQTASYELTVYIGGTGDANLVATVPDFYVTGSGVKNVSLAADAGIQVSEFTNADLYWFLTTTGTGTAIADDSFDPVIVFDDLKVVYNSPAWIMPPAGIQGNAILHDARRGDAGVETTFAIPLQTKNRISSLTITNDLQDNTQTPLFTFLATGALKAKDASGDYTVDVPYTFEEGTYDSGSGLWGKSKITVDAPVEVTSDTLMFYLKATPVEGMAQVGRLELDCGTRIWLDVSIADQSAPILMHSYPFDSNMDDAVGNVDGVVNGNASVAGGALVLDENGDYLSFDGSALDLNSYTAITTEYIFKGSTTANTGWTWTSYFGGNAGTDAFYTALSHWGREMRTTYSGQEILRNDVYQNDGNLHHIVSILTKDSLLLYRDGVRYDQRAITNGFTIDVAQNYLGKGSDAWADPTWQGLIYEFNIYDGVLTPDEIKAHTDAFTATLSDLSSDAGTLLPDFGSLTTTYVLSIPAGTASVNLSATASMSEATVSGAGEFTIESDPDTAVINVVSPNGEISQDYTVYTMVEGGDCFTPMYNLENLVPDPELTNISMFNGWGNRSILYGPEAYCGPSSGKVVGNNGGSIDVGLADVLKPNTKYVVRAMVKAVGSGQCQIGIGGNILNPDPFETRSTTNDQWEEINVTFTTQATIPGGAVMYFNNYGLNNTLCYIDNWELYEAPVSVAYVNEDQGMASTNQVDYDPIVQMMKMDPNFDIDVMVIAADSVVDLSGYDMVVVQETFSSGAAIYKPGGVLGLENINVPFIYNKAYALRNGLAITDATDPKPAAVDPGFLPYLSVSTDNQSNPLFTGITFDGDSVLLFKEGAADDGSAGSKAMQYVTNLDIVGPGNVANDTSMLGLITGITDATAKVCVNIIPAGTLIGEQDTIKAQMIAISQNYGAICKDGNMTDANLTMWRNAFYVAAGLEVPTDPIVNTADVDLSVAEGMVAKDSGNGSFQVTVPKGTTSVDLMADVTGIGAKLPVIDGLSDGMNAEYDMYVYTIGMDSVLFKVYVHVQSEVEILYVSASSGVYANAKAFDTNVYDALVEGGYSVTFAKKGAIFEWTPDGIVPFDYTPYAGMVIGGGESSSNVNDYAKRNYPIPCVSMQNDGPKNNKWGWVNDKKATEFAKFSDFTVETAQMKILDNMHPITADYDVDQLITWSDGTPDSADWPKEVKSYNLSDSIPGAIPLATFNEASLYPTMWAVPMGSDVRSMNGDYDTYEHVTTTSNVVLLYAFNDGLLYMTDDFKPLLLNSLDWALKYTTPIVKDGVYYNIIQKNSGLVFGADTDPVTQPAVMTPTGADDQLFQFIPVAGKLNTYNIQNKAGMYLSKAGTNNWTTLLTESTNGLLSEWILNGSDLSSITLQLVDNLENIGVAKSYLSTDDVTSGSNLYCDKPAQAVGSNGEFMLEAVIVPLTLHHSYPFDDGTARDVIAGADGVLQGDASVADGVVTLSGSGFVSLPGKEINVPVYKGLTFESVFTQTAGLDGFTVLCNFGQTSGTVGANYIICQPTRNDGDQSRVSISCLNTSDPWNTENGVMGNEIKDTQTHHVVVVVTADSIKYYMDGVKIGSDALTGDNSLANVSADTAYIGKSVYSGDPLWNGTVDLLNIYEGEMDAATVAARADELIPKPKQVAYVQKEGKTVVSTAADPYNDPIVEMLNADDNFEVTVIQLAADGTTDLSGYDVVVAQETFGSGDAVWKPGNVLGLSDIPVPFVYNKVYALKDGKAFSGGATGGVAEVADSPYLVVDP